MNLATSKASLGKLAIAAIESLPRKKPTIESLLQLKPDVKKPASAATERLPYLHAGILNLLQLKPVMWILLH